MLEHWRVLDDRLLQGDPATPGTDPLRAASFRTWPDSRRSAEAGPCNQHRPYQCWPDIFTSSGGNSAPHEEDFGQRAPL